MKNRATIFLKHILSMLSSVTKSKSMAIKSKAEAVKARVIMFSLLKNKKLPLLRAGSISHKIHALLVGVAGDHNHKASESDTTTDVQVLQNEQLASLTYYENDDDDKYPDLRHCLFNEEDEVDLGDPNGSVIDLVKNSKEQDGQDFKLEDEIDHVADLFIMKFHKRMRLQKLESFKRYQDMLERSA